MMYYYKANGGIIAVKNPIADAEEITAEEYAERKAALAPKELTAEQVESEYWANIPYDEAVNAKIRERYTESQEFAILRQRDEKSDEYATYYAYCEECKTLVKEKKANYVCA